MLSLPGVSRSEGMRDLISDELAAYSGQEVDKTYIARHGRRARRLIREVNAFLSGGRRRVYIPDHFCVDPESNSTVSSIVPMHSLVRDRYRDKEFCSIKHR